MSKYAIGEGHEMGVRDLSFETWLTQIPESIRIERYWQLTAYQKALYLFDLTWQDTQNWLRDVRGQALARQMIASADSICANIEEGYGRGFGKQLLYFYTVALGSARETKAGYTVQMPFTLQMSSKNAYHLLVKWSPCFLPRSIAKNNANPFLIVLLLVCSSALLLICSFADLLFC